MSSLAESMKLPTPEMGGDLTVMQALKLRHSERTFAETELSAKELSGLLWASMDKEKLKKGLGLADSMTLHLNHPVGHFVDGN